MSTGENIRNSERESGKNADFFLSFLLVFLRLSMFSFVSAFTVSLLRLLLLSPINLIHLQILTLPMDAFILLSSCWSLLLPLEAWLVAVWFMEEEEQANDSRALILHHLRID